MIENPSSKEVISLVNVNKTYFMGENQVHALQNVSFSIKEGELVSIMGPSGSGKSTCMNMIGCLDRPTSGQVFIDGKGTFEMTEKDLSVLRNRTVGFVFQQYHLLATMNVLEKVGLTDRISHYPHELSGGQKQRVSIARALVTKPKIILADEPTGALDSSTGKAVLQLFNEINKEGTTIVIVTHDPGIGASTKRCIRILDGKVADDKINSSFEANEVHHV